MSVLSSLRGADSDVVTRRKQSYPRAPNLRIDYSELPGPDELRFSSETLLTNLFYVQAQTVPSFYTSPDSFTISILCRIPSGQYLARIISRLYRQKAHVFYRKTEEEYTKVLLCSKVELDTVMSHGRFQRDLTVRLLSPDTLLDFQISTSNFMHRISGSPITLRDLADLQGITCVFR